MGGGGDTCIEKKVMMKNIRLTSVSSLFPHKVPQSSALEEDFADLGFLTIAVHLSEQQEFDAFSI